MIPINNMSQVLEQQNASEAQPQEEQPFIESASDAIASIISVLEDKEDAPKDYELEEWKDVYGNFYISSIDDDESYYIWRTLKRIEYKSMIKSGIANDQLRYEESVIVRCCLWPKMTIEKLAKENAGNVETLAKQILFKSGFVPDQMALSMIKII